MTLGRLILQTSTVNKIICRNFLNIKATKRDNYQIYKLRVVLTYGATIVLWALLFKKHSIDVQDYKRLNGLE